MKKFKYLSVIVLLVLTGCFEKENIIQDKNQVEELLLKDDLTFEVNSKLNLFSIINYNNVEIISPDEVIDTSTLGEKEITIIYKQQEEEKECTFKINIVDTVAPTIEFSKQLTTTIGTKIDLLEHVRVSDNSKETIIATVEGDYDFNKEGNYPLKYVAIDSSNNKSEENFVLIILKKDETPNIDDSKKPEDTQDDVESPSIDNDSSKLTKDELILEKKGNYKLNYQFSYVQQTDNFYAKNKQQIKNIIYTAINDGAISFKFFCAYDECFDEFEELVKNDSFFHYVNDFVHPYNSLGAFSFQLNKKANYIIVTGERIYTDEEISKIEEKVSSVMNSVSSSNDKIKDIHDYIVMNTKYADISNDKDVYHTAYGSLINGLAVCDGYTDAMAIFLNHLDIPNYRVSVLGLHGWNLVYINGKWLHIDVTWDDPVIKDNQTGEVLESDVISYLYYLISTPVLQTIDSSDSHKFNQSVYKEAK